MGASMSNTFDYSIQSLAYHPPAKSYNEQQNINFVTTIHGHRIATRVTSCMGRPYVPGAAYTDTRKFVIFSHGNADDIGTCQDWVKWFATTFDCHVLSYDYVNYGCSSPGLTSESNMNAAATAVFEYTTNHLGVPVDRILLVGKSLGTAATTYLAAQEFSGDINGVILMSPLASGIRAVLPPVIASRKILAGFDSLYCPSIDNVGKIQSPVFIIHGYADKVIDIVNARILARHVSPEYLYPPLFLHAGHNDIEETHPITIKGYISAFITHCESKCKNALVEYED